MVVVIAERLGELMWAGLGGSCPRPPLWNVVWGIVVGEATPAPPVGCGVGHRGEVQH